METNIWYSLIDVTENLLWNQHAENYKEIIETRIHVYRELDARMSLNPHVFYSHLYFFPSNLGGIYDEDGDRFNGGIDIIVIMYQGKLIPKTMGDYRWTLQREESQQDKTKI